jgi:mannose-6-phosphate isomerase-like protein (cupin superfamily)
VKHADLDVAGHGTLWATASDDLNATLLSWPPGEGVGPHRNAERDVLLVVVAGDGIVVVDGESTELEAHIAVIIPRGSARSITAGRGGLRYLSVHLRRNGLVQIQPAARAAEPDAPTPAERAAALFEARLQEAGEGICLSSLPMLADEVAAQVAGGDSALEQELVAQLRRRAGLHT